MTSQELSPEEMELIEMLVNKFEANKNELSIFLKQVLTALTDDEDLSDIIHSYKHRIKDVDHLRDKLQRKIIAAKAEGKEFDITEDNFLERVNDLVGIRLLHLYTAQLELINPILLGIFDRQGFRLLEGPFARTWDDESRGYFSSIKIETQDSDTLYTSVHYVIESASRLSLTCEIQVRTLSEEVWGEVDHELNYPVKTEILACAEQLKVLARVTSSVSRLVDSIFLTKREASEESNNPTNNN